MSRPWQPLLVLCSYISNGSSSYQRSIIDTKAKDKWCIWWSIDYSARVLQSCSNSSLLVIIMSCCVDNDGSFFTFIIRQDQGVWWWCQHCKWSIIHHSSHNCRWLRPALSSMRDLQFQSSLFSFFFSASKHKNSSIAEYIGGGNSAEDGWPEEAFSCTIIMINYTRSILPEVHRTVLETYWINKCL